MNKMIQILSSKQLIAVFSFCSLLNYYLIAVFIAVNYDVANELAGGPASMFTAFTFGPIAAAGLAFLTYKLLNSYTKKGKYLICAVGVSIQILLTTASIVCVLRVIFYV